MAKSKEKIKARQLRRSGISILSIARKLHVSKSSASTWCSDIQLTPNQIKHIQEQHLKATYAARMKGAQMNRERKILDMQRFRNDGFIDIGSLSRRDLFVVGLGLFAGEGFKYNNRTGFLNSDARIIKLILHWFSAICHITKDRFRLRVGINESHKNRIHQVEQYWSGISDIPLNQFTKPSFKKVKSKKIYENHNQHFGTLAITIRKSSKLQYQILGWLDALYKNYTI